MKYNRLKEIEAYIKKNKSLTLDELIEKFDISIQTLRRDLKELEENGNIEKVYGGVVYKEKPSVIDIGIREISSLDKKRKIGQIASALIKDKDVIFIDSGTTACQIVPYINKNVTIVSHSLLVIKELENRNDINAVLIGGQYRSDIKSFVFDTSDLPYNFDLAFVSTVGIDIKNGLTNNDFFEGTVKKQVIKHSKKTCVVLDDTKFDNVAFNKFGDIKDIDILVTNTKVDKKYIDCLSKYNILYICD